MKHNEKLSENEVKSVSSASLAAKQTVIKSITAVVCTAAVCFSMNSAVDKYTAVIIEAAKASTGNAVENVDMYPESNVSDADVPDVPSNPDETADGEQTTDIENAVDTDAVGAAVADDPTKYSTAQIVEYYNACLKKTYALPKLTIEKTEDIKIVIDDVTPGGEKVAAFGSKIVQKYAKATPYTDTFANGKSTTGGDDAEEFAMHAKLDASGAKKATVKKVNGGYEINITVAPETATLDRRPVYNSQCSNPLDLGAVDLLGLKVTQADFNYPGTTLKAVVDENGRVRSAECNMPMNGTGAGKLIISGQATVHGALIKSATFSF